SVCSVSFSPVDKQRVAISDGIDIFTWDWAKNKKPELCSKAKRVDDRLPDFAIVPVHRVTFSPDGKMLAWIDDWGGVGVQEGVTKKQVLYWGGRPSVPVDEHLDLVFTPDGKKIVYPGPNHDIRVREIATGKNLLYLSGHRGSVWGLALSGDGKTLASGSDDGTVRLWELGTGKERLILRGHKGGAVCVFS